MSEDDYFEETRRLRLALENAKTQIKALELKNENRKNAVDIAEKRRLKVEYYLHDYRKLYGLALSQRNAANAKLACVEKWCLEDSVATFFNKEYNAGYNTARVHIRDILNEEDEIPS